MGCPNKTCQVLSVALAMLTAPFAATAATILHDIDFDITTLYHYASSPDQYLGSVAPLSVSAFGVAAGDTLVTTVHFLAGQSITLTNNDYYSEGLDVLWDDSTQGYAGSHSTHTTAMTLFSDAGDVDYVGSAALGWNHAGGLNEGLYGDLITSAMNELTITGFTTTTTVDSMPSTSETFDTFSLYWIKAGQITLNDAAVGASVPVPSSLLLAGLGLLGVAARRKALRR